MLNVQLSNGNKHEAAEATLSLITGGAFDMVEGGKREEIIQRR
ncbi:hypothetical protein LCGC14_2710120 [marine sediment metagenome]|uniref:Uncharacterized protein n=1 Tax=marine sediment metagenome TaxID=412755 RepID=A0A0F9A0X0_9ZZZZ